MNIKNIGFYGDSFTFGQYLDFYDYGMTPCDDRFIHAINPLKKRCGHTHLPINHGYPSIQDYIHMGEQHRNWRLNQNDWWRRFMSLVSRRYPTKVGHELNVDVTSPLHNGMNNHFILEDLQHDDSDLKIVMLSHPIRDMFDDLMQDEDLMVYNIKNYYDFIMEKFSKIKNIRFIGSWLDEEDFVELPFYQERLIPIHGYPSIYHLRKDSEKQYTIGEDFPIEDYHPSQELHDIIAHDVCEYIRKEFK